MDTLTRSVAFALDSADDNDGLTLRGYAAVFGSVTRIDSWEGRFDEQIAPGAFKRTIAARTPKLQFDHGQHPLLGSIPIGQITDLREDPRGLYVEARLHDNWLTEPVRDAISSGSVDGMSFRFSVVPGKESWDKTGDVPMRIIREVKCAELGPVVFPAYEDTTVSVRSLAEHLADELDDEARADLAREFAEVVRPTPTIGLLGGPDHFVSTAGLVRLGYLNTNTTTTSTSGNLAPALVLTEGDAVAEEPAEAPDETGTLPQPATRGTCEPDPPEHPDPSPDTRALTREAATLRLLSLKGATRGH